MYRLVFQVSIDIGSIEKLRLGIFSEKKMLVVFYLNGVLCKIMFVEKFPPPSSYIRIEVRSFKRYVLPQSNLQKF